MVTQTKKEELSKSRERGSNCKMKTIMNKLENFVDKKKILSFVSQLYHGRSVIGIDIGASSVKVAQMTRAHGQRTLTKTSVVEIDKKPSQSKDNNIFSLEPGTLQALQKALDGIEHRYARVIVVVNGHDIVSRRMIVPSMPQQELLEAIRWELKDSLPFPVEEAIIDFKILGDVTEHGLRKLNLIAAASPRKTIEEYLSFFSKAGLKVTKLIPMSIALQNLIPRLVSDETVATIEMGRLNSELHIFQNNQLVFCRNLPITGEGITQSLMGALMSQQGKIQLTWEEAQQIKHKEGLPSLKDSGRAVGKITTTQVVSLIRPLAEQLAHELQRSFDFYHESSPQCRINRILLLGGAAQLKGLAEFLKDHLGIEVQPAETLKSIEGISRKEEGQLAYLNLAIGAAMETEEEMNLLPDDLKQTLKGKMTKMSLKVTALAFAAILILTFIGMRLQTASYEQKMKIFKNEESLVVPLLTKFQKNILLNQAMGHTPRWYEVFKELSHLVPENVYLTDMEADHSQVKLTGVVIEGKQPTEETISQLMLALEKSLFRNVRLVSTEKNLGDDKSANFQILCEADE